MQLDASGSLAIHPQVCQDFPIVGTKSSASTSSRPDRNRGPRVQRRPRHRRRRCLCALHGGAFGQDFGFNVGAGIDDLPGALLAELSGNFIGVYSHVALLLDGCNVSRWRLLPPPAGFSRVHARTAQQQAYAYVPASGTQDALVGLQGAGGAPQVTLTGPGTKPIQVTRDGINIDNGALVVRQPSTGKTLIEIPTRRPVDGPSRRNPGQRRSGASDVVTVPAPRIGDRDRPRSAPGPGLPDQRGARPGRALRRGRRTRPPANRSSGFGAHALARNDPVHAGPRSRHAPGTDHPDIA